MLTLVEFVVCRLLRTSPSRFSTYPTISPHSFAIVATSFCLLGTKASHRCHFWVFSLLLQFPLVNNYMKSVRKLSRKVMGEKRLKSDGEIGNDEVFSDSSAELECRSAPPIPDFPQFPFKMPSAIPGVGDCHICCEVVPSVKILNCGHCLCVACASRMTGGGRKPLSCPECRELTDLTAGVQSLPTKYFGKIKCDICLSQKDTDDMWWCNQCAMALCSKCSIKVQQEVCQFEPLFKSCTQHFRITRKKIIPVPFRSGISWIPYSTASSI